MRLRQASDPDRLDHGQPAPAPTTVRRLLAALRSPQGADAAGRLISRGKPAQRQRAGQLATGLLQDLRVPSPEVQETRCLAHEGRPSRKVDFLSRVPSYLPLQMDRPPLDGKTVYMDRIDGIGDLIFPHSGTSAAWFRYMGDSGTRRLPLCGSQNAPFPVYKTFIYVVCP